MRCAVDGCEREKDPKAGYGMCGHHYRCVKRYGATEPIFNARECAYCGVTFTPTHRLNTLCPACKTLSGSPEHKAEYNRLWREAHPQYSARKNDEWRRKNPARMKEYATRYKRENAEKVRANFARWEAQHPDHTAEWVRGHRERARLSVQRRRARRHRAETFVVTERDRRRALARTGGRCFYCQAPIAGTYIAWDHVVPLVAGGRNSVGNLVPCCRRCNAQKGSYLLSEWRYAKLLTVKPKKRRYADNSGSLAA